MITEEHLNHWLGEIDYALNGLQKEIHPDKVRLGGINVGVNGEAYVSFAYLQEKTGTIKGILKCIQDDMKNDPKEETTTEES